MFLKACKEINQYVGHIFFTQCEECMILETKLFGGKKMAGGKTQTIETLFFD